MKNYTKQLRNLLEEVTTIYKDFDGLKAIGAGASIGKNEATEYSDCDIIMIYDKLPDDDFLDKAFAHNKAERRHFLHKSKESIVEIYYVNGVECQFSHALEGFYDLIIKEVKENFSTEKMPQLIADGFQYVDPIYGHNTINRIKKEFNEFPKGLELKILKRFCKFGHFDELRYRFQKEDNFIWISKVCNFFAQNLIVILLGVNKKYIPGDFRKIKSLIDRMEFKPNNLYQRLAALYQKDPISQIDNLHSLCLEVFELVEKHCPEFDMKPVRAQFNTPQPALKL